MPVKNPEPPAPRQATIRSLSKDDIAHYQKIVVALNDTIRLMKEIDEVIEQHGGWPGAFHTERGAGTGLEEGALDLEEVAEREPPYGDSEH